MASSCLEISEKTRIRCQHKGARARDLSIEREKNMLFLIQIPSVALCEFSECLLVRSSVFPAEGFPSIMKNLTFVCRFCQTLCLLSMFVAFPNIYSNDSIQISLV